MDQRENVYYEVVKLKHLLGEWDSGYDLQDLILDGWATNPANPDKALAAKKIAETGTIERSFRRWSFNMPTTKEAMEHEVTDTIKVFGRLYEAKADSFGIHPMGIATFNPAKAKEALEEYEGKPETELIQDFVRMMAEA